jgi:hypothetical protein
MHPVLTEGMPLSERCVLRRGPAEGTFSVPSEQVRVVRNPIVHEFFEQLPQFWPTEAFASE